MAVNCRLRSANRSNTNNTWNVNSSGYLNNNNANNANRCQPDCAFPAGGWSAHSADRQVKEYKTQGVESHAREGEQYEPDAIGLRAGIAVNRGNL